MIWFETEKRKRNIANGYPEDKGLKDGHCNRSGCLLPLSELPWPQWTMRDHELHTEERLYYCQRCADMFNKDDAMRMMPLRCTVVVEGESGIAVIDNFARDVVHQTITIPFIKAIENDLPCLVARPKRDWERREKKRRRK